ncbi:MAG: hypothetical protein ACR65R_16025 [Methylomicrobium sp.]
MTYECALLCMHGMGNLTQNEFVSDIAKLTQNLAERLPAERFSKIYIPSTGIFYSDLTQQQEDAVWQAMITQGGLNTGLIRRNTVNRIRRFIISGFSDAIAFAGFNGSGTKQQYTQAQHRIYDALNDVHNTCGKVPVVIFTQSLGCQILSSYIWDAQLYWRNANSGGNFSIDSRSIWKNHQSTSNDDFLCLQTLKTLFTTGCNIPIFVSGFDDVRAIHNRQHGYNFNWFNYFDYDDVLGYPLAPLKVLFDPANPTGHGQSYDQAVTDISVNASDGIWGTILSSWNPLSHTQYWGDSKILEALADALK